MWQIRPGSDGVTVQFRTTADQFGQRDMEVIPGADNRVTMVEDGNHENWYVLRCKLPELENQTDGTLTDSDHETF